ncbi:MAG: sigma-54 dependent transcriptional regulator [Polyangiales bacterium]
MPATSRRTVLVVDDEPEVTSWLVEALEEHGYAAAGETDARRALARITEQGFDVVLSDIEMPSLRGIELLGAVHARRPSQLVVLMTAFGSIDLAMQAMRAGAADFVTKPFAVEALVHTIERTLRERRMRREIVRLRQASRPEEPTELVARTPRMRAAVDLARRAATTASTVLITGESGTGKGALARLIHASSARRAAPLVHLNCAALPASLVEAELFGARRGAFTDAVEDRKGLFEQAHQGTLFLDEVGEMALEVQPKLLQVLETMRVRPVGGARETSVDVRVIAATNRPLEEALRARQFRPDLYHRLNVIRIDVPPLRERVEDLVALVDQLLARLTAREERRVLGVSEEAMRWIASQPWPGNVRELANTLERAVMLSDHDVLVLDDFAHPPGAIAASSSLDALLEREPSLRDLERAYIRRVLEKTGGNKGRAAKILGLDRRTLYRKAAELKDDEGDSG